MKASLGLALAAMLAGCGTAQPPGADLPARTWRYYVANPAEIETMQEICRQWSSSSAPISSQPAVVAINCSNAAYAKGKLKTGSPGK